MRSILPRLAVVIPLGLALAGCVNDPPTNGIGSTTIGSAPYALGDFGTLTYRAVDLILAAAPQITAETPLVVASVADVQNLDQSSALGNIAADLIRTRLAQNGHAVSEIRLRSGVSLKPGNGEFFLSRNAQALMAPPSVVAILTGTYAAAYDKVYVSLKLISAADGHIISGADFVVPYWNVAGLLPQPHT